MINAHNSTFDVMNENLLPTSFLYKEVMARVYQIVLRLHSCALFYTPNIDRNGV